MPSGTAAARSRSRSAGELDRIVVQVQDPSTDQPEHEDTDVLADNGRGLLLVEEIASEWGSTPTVGGKRVWAELAVD